MDFIDGLPLSKGVNSILVVVDRMSKYAHFIGLKHLYNATTVAGAFMRKIVHLHGFPASIISDRDKVCLSHFWTELFRLHGTDLRSSTAYHPQTDGQTEIVNKGLETYLRCFVGDNPKSRAQWLAWAEFSYNTAPHLSTKLSPFKIIYGREPPHVLRIGRGHAIVDSVEEWLQERDAILDELHLTLLKSQNIMKHAADLQGRDFTLEIGEQVFVRLQPYRHQSLPRRLFEKLAARFYGPFEVIQKIGSVAYKLDLPVHSKIHPVFHVSQLKRSTGEAPVSSNFPSQLTADLELKVEPEDLLAVRTIQEGLETRKHVLIKWKYLPTFEATWEDLDTLGEQFPTFNLEDKVVLWERGNVMDRPNANKLITFSRRRPRKGPRA